MQLRACSANQFFVAIFIALVFLVVDTFVRPYHDFRCNALKVLTSMSMLITLLCGFASKLDWREEVVSDETLGWTLIVANFIIVLLILGLELIRRGLSVYRGARLGISFIKDTEAISATGVKSYEGRFRQSTEDKPVVVTVKTYPLHTYPDSRVAHANVQSLGSTENICPIYGLEVEAGVLYVATKQSESWLSEHVAQFGTCPISAQEFCGSLTGCLANLHAAGISHGNIRPETIAIDGSAVQYSDFARATMDCEADAASKAFVADRHMLACTILYTLSGGTRSNAEPLDFDDFMEMTEVGFGEDLFGQIRAGKSELMDLLENMLRPEVPLAALLKRPFFWSAARAVEYLGEEVGSLIDPGATQSSNKYQHSFIAALEEAADTELGGPFDEMKGEEGPSWSALMDKSYPLNPAGDGPGSWGEGRMAQQAPTDIEYDFAVYGKKPSKNQKDHRDQLLASNKPVEKMAGRRMVGMLKMIRNLAFAHRSQHVQHGRFNAEDEVIDYVLRPFPWLLMTVCRRPPSHYHTIH
jgi:hypothetical protein